MSGQLISIFNKYEKEFLPYVFTQIANCDLIAAYSRLMAAISNFSSNIEDEYFIRAFNKSKAHSVQLDKIVAKEQGHVLTATIDDLHKQRVDCVRSIKKILEARLIHDDVEMKNAAKLVNRWFKHNAGVLPYGSQDGVTRAIEELFKQVDDNKEFSDAITRMGLDDAFSSLRTIDSAYVSVRLERLILWSGERVPKINSIEIKNEAVGDLSILLQAIESFDKWKVEGTEGLVEVVRLEFERIKAIILQAETLRKNKRNPQPASSSSAVPMPAAEKSDSDINSSNDFLDKPADIDTNGTPSESSQQAI